MKKTFIFILKKYWIVFITVSAVGLSMIWLIWKGWQNPEKTNYRDLDYEFKRTKPRLTPVSSNSSTASPFGATAPTGAT